MDTNKPKDAAEALDVSNGSAFRERYGTPAHPNGDPILMALDIIQIAKLSRSLSDSPVSFMAHIADWADKILPPNSKR